MKLNVATSAANGKRIATVEDPLVRGTTRGITCRLFR